jgi:DUF2971 family protein
VLVYHFLSAEHALEDLSKRRIKIAEFDDLNDPYELLSPLLSEQRNRKIIRDWKSRLARISGVLCFSLGWDNPLLWSHYGDRHEGICLGFEVSERFVTRVRYAKKRVLLNSGEPLREQDLTREILDTLFYTKFHGWKYEHEVRRIISFKNKDRSNGHYFQDFDPQLRLAKVICGPLCGVREGEIKTAIQSYPDLQNIQVLKATLARTRFRVRESKLGFGTTQRKRIRR